MLKGGWTLLPQDKRPTARHPAGPWIQSLSFGQGTYKGAGSVRRQHCAGAHARQRHAKCRRLGAATGGQRNPPGKRLLRNEQHRRGETDKIALC